MRELYNYIFYKIARFYEKTEGHGLYSGTLLAVGCAMWIILAIINVLLAMFHFVPTRNFYLVYGIVIVIIVFLISRKYDTEEKYLSLCKKYEHEKSATLKGWLVFLYVLFSILLMSASLYLVLKKS